MPFTPGPWQVEKVDMHRSIDGAYFVCGPDGERICRLTVENEPRDINAYLIAAAPDLLAFVQRCASGEYSEGDLALEKFEYDADQLLAALSEAAGNAGR
jgi:hypothetical protein